MEIFHVGLTYLLERLIALFTALTTCSQFGLTGLIKGLNMSFSFFHLETCFFYFLAMSYVNFCGRQTRPNVCLVFLTLQFSAHFLTHSHAEINANKIPLP